jgi:hypothetical protein
MEAEAVGFRGTLTLCCGLSDFLARLALATLIVIIVSDDLILLAITAVSMSMWATLDVSEADMKRVLANCSLPAP